MTTHTKMPRGSGLSIDTDAGSMNQDISLKQAVDHWQWPRLEDNAHNKCSHIKEADM